MSDVVAPIAGGGVPDPAMSALALDTLEHSRLGAALDAVRAAISVCRRVQQRSGAGARLKGDHSPVTLADFASQAVVGRALRRVPGTAALVAEEDPAFISTLGADYLETVVAVVCDEWPDATPESVRDAIAAGTGAPGEDGFWTLDPVDGTKGFLRNQQYAIALAYVESGRPTLAVLGCPNLSCDLLDDPATAIGTGIVCFAVEGHGAFEVPADDPGAAPRRLTAASPHGGETVRVCASVERAHGDASGLAAVMQQVSMPCGTVGLDSQCKYAVVARGQADAYLRVSPSPDYAEWIWDHAAGSLIATESGCLVTDLSGRPLDFSHGRRLHANRGVLCARPEWHTELLRAVRSAGLGKSCGAAT